MLLFLTRRILIALPTIILISIFVFALQKLLPGDPLLVLAGEERDPAVLELLREKYRLNDPIVVQYFTWVSNALQGDLGISLRTNQPVTELMLQKLPVTLQLAAMSMIFALVIGVPAGILSAYKKGSLTDYIANVVALSGLSIPNFWLGIMLILLVSVKWQLLPASGYVPLSEAPGQYASDGEDFAVSMCGQLAMPPFRLFIDCAGTVACVRSKENLRRALELPGPHQRYGHPIVRR